MGCQASKLYRQKDRVKAKLTSLLRWRLDAMKRQRSLSSISKQMLLKPDLEDGSINDRKSSILSYPELDDDSIGDAERAPDSINPDVEACVSIDKEALAMEKLTLEEKDEDIERLKKERPPVFPASPSFRLYLTDNDKEEDCSSEAGKDELPIEGSFSDADVDAFEPRTSSDELGSNMKKRGRRGMRFRRVIPMGRPVKNFLRGL